MAAALATARGLSRIVETVWLERFGYVDGLRAMGADVRVEGAAALLRGTHLHGAVVEAYESRAAAAYAVAGLAAEGETVVLGVPHMDRVCERFVDKMASIGGQICEAAVGLEAVVS